MKISMRVDEIFVIWKVLTIFEIFEAHSKVVAQQLRTYCSYDVWCRYVLLRADFASHAYVGSAQRCNDLPWRAVHFALFPGTEFAGDSFLQKVKLEIVVSKDQVFLITLGKILNKVEDTICDTLSILANM